MVANLRLTQDRRLESRGNGGVGRLSWCWLRVYHEPDTTNVVVVFVEPIEETTGDYANPGMSITNAAERLATLIRQQMGGLEPVMWLHYYPARGQYNRLPEEFSQVIFERWDGHRYWHPSWKFMRRAQVEEVLGGPFVDLPSVAAMRSGGEQSEEEESEGENL